MPQLLLQICHLSKSFASGPLFEKISLSIHREEIFALVGENGAGKTTLLRLFANLFMPDSGSVLKQPGLKIGLLPQEIHLENPAILTQNFLAADDLNDLESRMTACLENEQLTEWEELHQKYEMLGGYRRIPMEQALAGLKLGQELLSLPFNQLSSGEKMRVALAKALMENPDVLLLDEPTNYLDAEMLLWLKKTLLERKGATIIVSHDRKFINATCNRLIEIKQGELNCYGGNWDFYLSEQKKKLEKEQKAFEIQEEEGRLLRQKIKSMTFSKGKPAPPSDRNHMAYDSRGESHQKSLQRNLNLLKERLEKLEANLLEKPKPKIIQGLKFANAPLSQEAAIEIEGIAFNYGEKNLFSGFSKILRKGDRIVLTGSNGAGKTTLLRCLLGELAPSTGKIRIAKSAKIGYLDQEAALLFLEKTPIAYFEEKFQISEETLRRELHKAAIGGEELLNRSFSSLSTGQRKRMMLLSLILSRPNVLILDEPTNHLDFMTLEALEKALLAFDGALLAVSHDQTFIEKIATEIWYLK